MTGIVQLGVGNLSSVASAVEFLDGKPFLITTPNQLESCERIILPGVGSFSHAMQRLRGTGFATALHEHVINLKKPILGICLGMQLMATQGSEGGRTDGLGWLPGSVDKVCPQQSSERVPHVGWNSLVFHQAHALLEGIPAEADFYFVHSYTLNAGDPEVVIASCNYGTGVTAILAKENIFATQFHPEKSQDYGLKLLENFLGWRPFSL